MSSKKGKKSKNKKKISSVNKASETEKLSDDFNTDDDIDEELDNLNLDDVEDEEDEYEINDEIDLEEDTSKNNFYNLINSDAEDSELTDDEEEDDNILPINNIVKNEDRITKKILTKYEYVRLLSERTVQLSEGASSMINNTEKLSYKEIAKLEIKNKVIPLIIERVLPNGLKERFKISELEIKKYI
jgi:DNA-directed RNA polymerase subunit K/omega